MNGNKPRELDQASYMEEHLKKVLTSFGYKIDSLQKEVTDDPKGYQGIRYNVVIFERFD